MKVWRCSATGRAEKKLLGHGTHQLGTEELREVLQPHLKFVVHPEILRHVQRIAGVVPAQSVPLHRGLLLLFHAETREWAQLIAINSSWKYTISAIGVVA